MDTGMNELKHLSTDQLESFNTEYVNGDLWIAIVKLIDEHFGAANKFTFLDIGGGNGVFTDRLLEQYPQSEAVLLDNASNLIEINKIHPRKIIIMDSVENLEKYLNTYNFDIVFINWVLHHLVSNTYKDTRSNIINTLTVIKRSGKVKYLSVFENMYNGIFFDTLPSKLIYQMTSLQSIKFLTKKMGANTAGIGVSFLSRKMWVNIFNSIFGNSNLNIIDFGFWGVPVVRKIFLHIKSIYISLFWIKVN